MVGGTQLFEGANLTSDYTHFCRESSKYRNYVLCLGEIFKIPLLTKLRILLKNVLFKQRIWPKCAPSNISYSVLLLFMVHNTNLNLIEALLSRIQLCRNYALFGIWGALLAKIWWGAQNKKKLNGPGSRECEPEEWLPASCQTTTLCSSRRQRLPAHVLDI